MIGVAAGMLSGLLGIGGGILMVPAFSAWVGIPLKETIATSLACVGIFAIPGTLTHWYLGHIDWAFAICARDRRDSRRADRRATSRSASSDRALRYSVGAALGIIAVIYAIGELLALVKCTRCARRPRRASARVSRPVNVFCWLGWNAPTIVIRPARALRARARTAAAAREFDTVDATVRSAVHVAS